jgi:hypothetical protein
MFDKGIGVEDIQSSQKRAALILLVSLGHVVKLIMPKVNDFPMRSDAVEEGIPKGFIVKK